MRRLTCVLIIILLLLSPMAMATSPDTWNPGTPEILSTAHLYSRAAVLIDARTGDTLFEKEAYTRMYPASTTKIMTLMLALESDIPLDGVVTIPNEAGAIGGDSSKVPVSIGENMSFQDLLYGLMLKSGNDAANAIAVIVGGSLTNFVAQMNNRASELNCMDTHFTNPHGLHDPNHYSTAHDLAIITKTALENEEFRKIVSTSRYTMARTNKRDSLDISNTNSMINPASDYYDPECIGVKTGFTNNAGQCFVGATYRDGVTLISVVLHSAPDSETLKWNDTRKLFAYGYTQFVDYPFSRLFADALGENMSVKLDNAIRSDAYGGVLEFELAQLSNSDYSELVSKTPGSYEKALASFKAGLQFSVREGLKAPVDKGEIIGSISFKSQVGEVITGSLIASRTVAAQPAQLSFIEVFPFMKVFTNPYVLFSIVGVIVALVVLAFMRSRKRSRRNKQREEIYNAKRREYERRLREEERIRREKLRRQSQELRRQQERRYSYTPPATRSKAQQRPAQRPPQKPPQRPPQSARKDAPKRKIDFFDV